MSEIPRATFVGRRVKVAPADVQKPIVQLPEPTVTRPIEHSGSAPSTEPIRPFENAALGSIEPHGPSIEKVRQIQDQAIKLGWSLTELQGVGEIGRMTLACLLRPEDQIVEINEAWIAIRGQSGVRLRFYRPSYRHGWISDPDPNVPKPCEAPQKPKRSQPKKVHPKIQARAGLPGPLFNQH